MLALTLIERLKVISAHVHLTAHFQHLGQHIGRGGGAQRHLAHGAQVLRDVFPGFTITPCGGLHQHTVFVTQVDGQPIKLELRQILHLGVTVAEAQLTPDPCIKGLGSGGFGVGFGADAQHGNRMAHL